MKHSRMFDITTSHRVLGQSSVEREGPGALINLPCCGVMKEQNEGSDVASFTQISYPSSFSASNTSPPGLGSSCR